MHNIIPPLPEPIKKQLAAVILFGDTRNAQTNATIAGVPKENLISFCVGGDEVCWGKLVVKPAHLDYLKNGDVKRAIDFAIVKVDAALKAKSPK